MNVYPHKSSCDDERYISLNQFAFFRMTPKEIMDHMFHQMVKINIMINHNIHHHTKTKINITKHNIVNLLSFI